MLTGHMKGSEMVIPVDMLQTIKENVKESSTLTDTPPYAEYGYTKDGVVQCIAARNVCVTRMKQDRQRNPGSKFQMIYAPELVVGEVFEGINEAKSDQDMVKDGLKYAKKKYKYNPKQMKELASDTLQYIKSGEIDDQASMEAYIDFRNDEMSEACKKDKLKETIRSIVKEMLNEGSQKLEIGKSYQLYNYPDEKDGIKVKVFDIGEWGYEFKARTFVGSLGVDEIKKIVGNKVYIK
jgi:hypothetical protein